MILLKYYLKSAKKWRYLVSKDPMHTTSQKSEAGHFKEESLKGVFANKRKWKREIIEK